MENRVKEQQLDLFTDRTSCHRWWPNQFRLLLSSLAYMLLEAIRHLALQGMELANVYVGTLRLKPLKVGAKSCAIPGVSVSCYRVPAPQQRLFCHAAARLAPGQSRQLLFSTALQQARWTAMPERYRKTICSCL